MKTIAIGNSGPHDVDRVESTWIRERVRELRSRGMPVCVKVIIAVPPINIIVMTPGCSDSEPDNPRPLRPEEKRLFNQWERHGLKKELFDVDQLEMFIREIRHI
jgi:hypothetical protein